MLSPRENQLLVNCFYVLLVATTFSNLCLGLIFTIVGSALLFFFRIPPIKPESVKSRLQQISNDASPSSKVDDIRRIILHRGGVYDRPENTLEAVRLAKEVGAGAVEIDLEFTEDGVGICLHDSTLDRTTDGSGPVGKMKYEAVRKLDAAAKHKCREETGPMTIPTLEECVKECLKLDLFLYIDCKSQPEKTSELLQSLYKKYPDLYNKGIVCSFHPQLIYAVRKKDAGILTAITHRSRVLSCNLDGTPRNKEMWKRVVSPLLDIMLQWSMTNWMWYVCGNSFFLLQKDDISQSAMKYWSNLDIQLVPWTVNSPKEKDYFLSIGCPIITDGMDSS